LFRALIHVLGTLWDWATNITVWDPEAFSTCMPISAYLVRILATLNTAFPLVAKYDENAIVALSDICRHYFPFRPEKLFRKAVAVKFPLPVLGSPSVVRHSRRSSPMAAPPPSAKRTANRPRFHV
jgi:hypothetical protein